MTTAAFVIYPKFQAFDNNGDPASGYKLFTYVPGTTTKQATYTTPAANVTNSNPVVLDSRGEANVCLDGSLLYKLYLAVPTMTDPPTSAVWSVDNVGATADGVSFLQAGTGAVRRTMQSKERDVVSVKDFGATGDGVTNDTAAVQAAYDAVFTAGGGTLYFPAGIYLITTLTKHFTSGATYVNLVGAGMKATIIRKFDNSSSDLVALSTIDTIISSYNYIGHLTLEGNVARNCSVLKLTYWARMLMEHVEIAGGLVGLDGSGLLSNTFVSLVVHDNGTGIKCRTAGGNVPCNANAFFGAHIYLNTVLGFDYDEGNGLLMQGTKIENNGTAGNTATGGVSLTNLTVPIGVATTAFNGVHLEGNLGRAFQGGSSNIGNLSLTNMVFLTSEGGRALYLPDFTQLTLKNVVSGVGDVFTLGGDFAALENVLIATLTSTCDSLDQKNVQTGIGVTARSNMAFNAYAASTLNNVTGNNDPYVVIWDTELFDQGGCYDPVTGIFTAKVAADYRFSAVICFAQIAAGHTAMTVNLVLNSGSHQLIGFNPAAVAVGGLLVVSGTTTVHLAAGATAKILVTVTGGAKAVDIEGILGASSFSGEIVS